MKLFLTFFALAIFGAIGAHADVDPCSADSLQLPIGRTPTLMVKCAFDASATQTQANKKVGSASLCLISFVDDYNAVNFEVIGHGDTDFLNLTGDISGQDPKFTASDNSISIQISDRSWGGGDASPTLGDAVLDKQSLKLSYTDYTAGILHSKKVLHQFQSNCELVKGKL